MDRFSTNAGGSNRLVVVKLAILPFDPFDASEVVCTTNLKFQRLCVQLSTLCVVVYKTSSPSNAAIPSQPSRPHLPFINYKDAIASEHSGPEP